ncbi:bifunctional protein-serine/threonine kinase/phosphatase [Donghicola mangrovi]|uniref:Bifunctional protein-serine/threonine kinase/phosphatase n=1 Tax=Donghicola mangrovi TaxID=2729614 RepID=A0A850QG18_9RHOB|nr:bifunctional protein-serine/threonine kinase/phosphatase [Donghicola mangrovi]NVO25325.1 bifunctional protein-serine/threonine kinase/phosphatase [Donghicola mangrovi]
MTPQTPKGYAAVKGQFPTHPLKAVMGGYSSAGVKPRNDDAISGRIPDQLYELHTKGATICIADGISTGRNSYKAAQTSVMQFAQDYYSAPESWPVADCASRLIQALNGFFYTQNKSGSPEAEGQVTTFTAMIARSTTAHVVHVGDTRCLLLRNGKLTCLTSDHTSRYMGEKEVLTRALGIDSRLNVDYSEHEMKAGDVFVLLSDGVHSFVRTAAMAELLQGPLTTQTQLERAARALCDAALAAGSDDNISAMMMALTALPSETLTEAHRRLTTLAIPPALQPGNKIDGWKVIEVLHASTRSHVYKVRRVDHGDEDFVLKAPSRNFADSLQYLEGFTLEQWVGRKINHPQVMKILPHEDSSFLYCIAEWVEGETLRDWMKRHPVPRIRDVLPILESLVTAVRVFHRLGMVHRDLKPENIMILADGTAKIIDFGSVQVAGFKGLLTGADEDLPEGSVNYIAPEVLAGRSASNLSDLFSIAAIAYEMIAGKVPFDHEKKGDRLSTAAKDWVPKALTDLRPDMPSTLQKALERALSYDPSKRPQVMTELLGEIRNARKELAAGGDFVPLLERGSKTFWRTWALTATGVAAALLVTLLVR